MMMTSLNPVVMHYGVFTIRRALIAKVLFSNRPWSKQTCSTLSLLNKFALWTNLNFRSSDPTVTSDPLYSLWERSKMIDVNFVFAMVKMHSTINDNDMLSYSLTTMMCFLTKE